MTVLARIALVMWIVVIGLVTLSPHNNQTQARGDAAIEQADRHVNLPGSVPRRIRVAEADVIGNVLLFVPLGFLDAVSFRERRRVAVLLGGVALTAAIESVQGVFLAARTASIADVATNSAGHVFGLVGASVLLWVTTKRVHEPPNPR